MVETTNRRFTVDLVVNVRFRTTPLLVAAPVVCLTALDLLATAVALLGLVADLSGSHLRLSTSARM
ncbi:hypothetical protein [Streptomyces novaecaesareae]|uniref:hypothetical protein n=1 Tax=Streptomyces novaecaesareae TaxID=68244 RepID=UPI000B1D9793|nr:hypothetical protein [Streptomyces novaecaesareae]